MKPLLVIKVLTLVVFVSLVTALVMFKNYKSRWVVQQRVNAGLLAVLPVDSPGVPNYILAPPYTYSEIVRNTGTGNAHVLDIGEILRYNSYAASSKVKTTFDTLDMQLLHKLLKPVKRDSLITP